MNAPAASQIASQRLKVHVHNTAAAIMLMPTQGTHFGFGIDPSTNGRWRVRTIVPSDLRSIY